MNTKKSDSMNGIEIAPGTKVMSYARRNEKTITIQAEPLIQITVWWERTRSGFRHLAVLRRNHCEVNRAKYAYINRTWESYEYESVISKVLHGYFRDDDAKKYKAIADAGGVEKSVGVEAELAPLRGLANMAQAFGALASTPEEAVRIKKASVVAMGCTLPEGFDALPTEEKLRRLDAALNSVKETP